ncbi:MAG: diaminopimelate epimerase [Thermoguttaceae bacterium]|nr:diaminopimelate epimerase [Thermoguttaceae bacterium]
MNFIKMHGAGNDYVYVDCFRETLPEPAETLAPKISDRHFGVGSDGLILITPSDKAAARMRMYNADGSESEMCGNGVRCVAKYVHDAGYASGVDFPIETGAGVLAMHCELEDGRVARVRVDMGEPILAPADIPTTLRSVGGEAEPVIDVPLTVKDRTFRATAVSMGNPHCVIFVDEPTDELVLGVGPLIETAPEFPRRVNVEFAQVISPEEMRMRVWERGAGETLACGTGTCALSVAAALSGRCRRRVLVHLLGGDLQIEWAADNHVLMTGPAAEVFRGQWPNT